MYEGQINKPKKYTYIHTQEMVSVKFLLVEYLARLQTKTTGADMYSYLDSANHGIFIFLGV